MTNRFILWRIKGDFNQTLGVFMVVDANGWPLLCLPCLERGDRNNKKNVSSANAGIYPIVLEYSNKFEMLLWELKETGSRSEMKVHIANFWKQLEGCIALGMKFTDLDNDGYQDVAQSGDALKLLNELMEGITETTITIIDPPTEVISGPLLTYVDQLTDIERLHDLKKTTVHPDSRERIQLRIDRIYRDKYFAV